MTKGPLSGNDVRSGKITDMQLWKWMLSYLKNYKSSFIAMIAGLLALTVIDAILPSIQQKVIDEGIIIGAKDIAINLIIIYSAMMAISLIGSAILNYFLGKYGTKIIQEMRLDLFKNVQNMSMDYFESHNTGDLISTATNDIDQLNMIFSGQLATAIVGVFKLFLIIAFMIRLNWEMTIISILVIPLLIIVIMAVNVFLRNSFRKVRAKISTVTQVIQQNISGIKVIKSYGREKESIEEFEKANRENREAMFATGKIMSVFFPTFTFIIYSLTSIILLYAGYGLLNNGITLFGSTITIGELSAFNSYMMQMIFPVIMILMFKQISDNALASAERIYSILNEENSIKETKHPKQIKNLDASIDFEQVYFNYKSREETAKKDINVLLKQFNPMEKMAISRLAKNFTPEKKLTFIERYLDLKDDEKSVFMKKMRNEKNAPEIMSKFTQTFSTDLPNKELAKILEKRLKGEYSEISLNMGFNLNNIDEFIQSKSLTNTQILEILSKAPKEEGKPFSNEIKKAIKEYEYLASKKKEDVLKNINLHIPKGKTVAFVGETGAGKSTIIKVLARFYDIKSGEIKIGGINIKDFKLNDLRSIMGMVPQDNYLFSGTILENLYYGLSKKPEMNGKLLKITKNIGLHDFIKELPLQYETPLNEMGTNLSIGQRQLICFARVLMIEPKILLLDEATSSIDPYTEKIIQEAIKKISKGRTTFIIAHRLSTIANADIICVMDNGMIIEQGSHDELMKKKARYFELVNSINQ